jgi:hypothetical protein
VTGAETLQAAFAGSGASLAEFGRLLAAASAPGREPFTRQYISGLLHGRFPVTAEIERAATYMLQRQDNVDEVQARARPVTVPLLALYPPTANALILGHDRPCANPGCPVHFYPASPRQRFHSRACRLAAAQLKRGGSK